MVRVTFDLPASVLNSLDNIVKISEIKSRSEAVRDAIKAWIKKQFQDIDIAKFLDQLTRGEIPDFLKNNSSIDPRKKKDLEQLEQMLKTQFT